MPPTYSFQNIKKLIKEPSLIKKAPAVISKDIRRSPIGINRIWYNRRYKGLGEEFINEDWDNLLILDAARPDIISELGILEKERLCTKYSPGSSSKRFIESQFSGRELHDTVYITANPHAENISDSVFHAIINLLDSHWDEQTKTVHPESVIEATVEAHEEFPHKRLIVHFMQPHYPFIGPSGDHVEAGIGGRHHGINTENPWFNQMWGEKVDPSLLRKSYVENREIALDHAIQLIDLIDGKSVITADHANLIGERGFPIPIKMYGHPHDFPHPKLIEVPWVEFDGEGRETRADPPIERETMDNAIVEERLQALGYQ